MKQLYSIFEGVFDQTSNSLSDKVSAEAFLKSEKFINWVETGTYGIGNPKAFKLDKNGTLFLDQSTLHSSVISFHKPIPIPEGISIRKFTSNGRIIIHMSQTQSDVYSVTLAPHIICPGINMYGENRCDIFGLTCEMTSTDTDDSFWFYAAHGSHVNIYDCVIRGATSINIGIEGKLLINKCKFLDCRNFYIKFGDYTSQLLAYNQLLDKVYGVNGKPLSFLQAMQRGTKFQRAIPRIFDPIKWLGWNFTAPKLQKIRISLGSILIDYTKNRNNYDVEITKL